MDENKNYKDPEHEGDDNDTYDPYEEYVKDKVHERSKRRSMVILMRAILIRRWVLRMIEAVPTNHITDVLLILRRLASQ